MSKHTPGPWRIGTPPPNGEQTIGTLNGLMVAVATTGQDIPTKANAVLISKAPAMYELLQRILYAGEWYTSALEIDRDKDGRILCGEIEDLLTQIKEQTK